MAGPLRPTSKAQSSKPDLPNSKVTEQNQTHTQTPIVPSHPASQTQDLTRNGQSGLETRNPIPDQTCTRYKRISRHLANTRTQKEPPRFPAPHFIFHGNPSISIIVHNPGRSGRSPKVSIRSSEFPKQVFQTPKLTRNQTQKHTTIPSLSSLSRLRHKIRQDKKEPTKAVQNQTAPSQTRTIHKQIKQSPSEHMDAAKTPSPSSLADPTKTQNGVPSS